MTSSILERMAATFRHGHTDIPANRELTMRDVMDCVPGIGRGFMDCVHYIVRVGQVQVCVLARWSDRVRILFQSIEYLYELTEKP